MSWEAGWMCCEHMIEVCFVDVCCTEHVGRQVSGRNLMQKGVQQSFVID